MKKIILGVIFLFFSLVVFFCLLKQKIICINFWFAGKYEVTGIDVSHYQGTIDWKLIEKQNVAFAIIKATEGSTSQDQCFKKNWENASNTDIILGAYHFFSFDSSAQTQAENYINTVGSLKGKLPPVVDFEYYGDKESNPPELVTARQSLMKFLQILETYYGKKPIIYATKKMYTRYLENYFDEYPIWIRNVYYSPDFDMKEKWVFWQYTDRGILNGCSGKEKYIDLDIFNGSMKKFKELIQ